MSNKLSNFIGYLKNHKIFETSDSANSPANLIAVRDNDVITVSNKVVKYSTLDVKQQRLNEVYDLLTVDFTVKSLVLNSSGTLLAIVGDADVAYCYLPTSGTSPSVEKEGIAGSSYRGSVKNHKIQIGRATDVGAAATGSRDSSNSTSTSSTGSYATATSSSTTDRSSPSDMIAVLKVIWNPIAYHDSSLVILTTDGFLRSYNILNNDKFPDFKMNLTKSELSSTVEGNEFTFREDELIQDPISISFGSESDPLGKLTLYILTKDGDIFALCPFLPSKFILSNDELSELFDNAVTLQYQFKQQEEDRKKRSPSNRRFKQNFSLKNHYHDQLSYITELWRQIKHSPQEGKLSKNGSLTYYYILSRPYFSNLQEPQPQGPFRYQPFPNELYEGHGVDLITTNSGSMTTIVVLYSTGRINFYLQDISLDMKWVGNRSISDVCLALFESISVPGGSSTNTTGSASSNAKPPFGNIARFGSASPTPFGSSPTSSSLVTTAILQDSTPSFKLIQTLSNNSSNDLEFYVTCNSTVYRIDISAWAIPLTKAIEESNTHVALSIIHNHEPTDIWVVLDSSTNKQPILGLGSIPDPFGTYIQFIQTKKLVYVEIPAEYDNTPPNASDNKTSGPKADGAIHPLKFASLLHDQQKKEIDELISSINLDPPTIPKGVSVTGPITPDVDHLNYFSALSEYFSLELKKLHQAGLLVHDRLTLQRSELHKQIERVSEIYEKVRKLEKERPTDILGEILKKQERLRLKSLSFLENLSRRHTLLLSNQEKKWFEELKRSQERVYEASGLERRVKNVSCLVIASGGRALPGPVVPRFARNC